MRLGRTDLYVSRVCHGTSFCTVANLADNLEALGSSIELGVNFFDASNAYFYSEEILGKAIAGRRDRVVICTKVHPFRRPETLDDPYEPDEFSREFLFAEAEDALRRLGTDYIDLYLLHNPDRVTPAGMSRKGWTLWYRPARYGTGGSQTTLLLK